MKKILLFILSCSIGKAFAQEKRSFDYHGVKVHFFTIKNVKNNRMPNHNAQIIVLDDREDQLATMNNLDEKYKRDETISYFVNLSRVESSKKQIQFLRDFIAYNFHRDFFDRNTTKLILPKILDFNCKEIDQLNRIVAEIQVINKDEVPKCGKSFVYEISKKSQQRKTSIEYKKASLDDMIYLKDTYKMNQALNSWDNTFFMSASYGHHSLVNGFKTTFDEETLVDFSEVNENWSFKLGYMFSDAFGANLQLSFLLDSQNMEREVEGVSGNLTINASGSASGIFKIGIGGRYVPYIQNRLSVYTDLYFGSIIASAGGGSGSVTVTNNGFSETRNLIKQTERAFYLSPEIGLNYRLGKTLFATTNLNYTYSRFRENIGSVTGFSGYSLNFGLGISF